MEYDVPPADEEILAILAGKPNGIEPHILIAALRQDNEMSSVIEALQRALERGKIALNGQGMVVAAAELAEAA